MSGSQAVIAPRLVILVDGFTPRSDAATLPALREAMERGRHLGVTTICLVDAPEVEPSEVDVRVLLSERDTGYDRGATST